MIYVYLLNIIRKNIGVFIILGLMVSSPAWGREHSVWGIPSGSSFNMVSQAIAQRGGRLIQDITALDMGRLRQSLFEGVFFNKPCSILVTFYNNRMTEFQFRFFCFLNEKSKDISVSIFDTYEDLTLKLRSKYGYVREKREHDGGETQIWSADGVTISLACDRRSATKHTTVLTYVFSREEKSGS